VRYALQSAEEAKGIGCVGTDIGWSDGPVIAGEWSDKFRSKHGRVTGIGDIGKGGGGRVISVVSPIPP